MIITLTGFPGSGKSNLGRRLAEALGLRFYSIGEMRRKMAFQRGMSLEEFNKLGEEEEFTDKEADDYIVMLAKKEDDFVLDAKLGYHFIPNSVKICVIVSFEEGAKRIWTNIESCKERNEGDYKSYEETLQGIKSRVKSDIERYRKYYGIEHCMDKSLFDLIIDSTNLGEDIVFEKAVEFVRKKQ